VGVEIAHPLAARRPAEELMSGVVAVHDGFICEQRIGELIRCAGRRRERGDFAGARIGAGHGSQLRGDIRGDRTCWFAAPLFEAERALLGDLEQLRLDLNRGGYLGLFDLELHYAWYAPGTGYARHVDQPQGRDQRKVSLVLYLNDAWTPDAGGELRIFDGNEARDIEPIAGRLVCFLTEGREHAVLTTRRDRLSITGWFRQRS
jgi:SM-20-related protein